ncbi:GIY-YIG nuclease family protein [Flavobacterium sp. DGU11]|uniref:GIY-YIG nuclease family protein n=1 Tax=Flavobacterium arundinis TaxID=3139143 RepID=A0ABU9HYL8_9FLAO
MIACYILYNLFSNKYYVGFTQESMDERLEKHNSGFYDKSYTATIAGKWEVYILIECMSVSQALKIEKHIKAMKSKKYIQNLKVYPEIIDNLKQKYK